MLKSITANTLALGIVLAGSLWAQQTSSTPSAKPKTSTTAKSSTAAKKPVAKKPAEPLKLTTEKDKVSYAIGMSVANTIRRQSVDVDPKLVARAITDSLGNGKTALTDTEAQQTLAQLQGELRKQAEAKAQQLAENNKKEGEAFLAANKANQGVVTLPSGLQYKILTAGTGPKPTASDSVVCHYRGTLINGTEFDSSYKRGQPATFPVSGVIKGWTEALQLMPVGSKWQLFIPSNLAYGEHAPPEIGPNATLIFDVELLSIQNKAETKPEAK